MFNALKNKLEVAVAWLDGQPAGFGAGGQARIEPKLPAANDGHKSQEVLPAPILIPESPLINFLSQLTLAQRLGIRNITVSSKLGYRTDQRFSDAESLYKWLTPGRKMTFDHPWPAEQDRIKWYRVDITAEDIIGAAEVAHDTDSLKGIVGVSQF
ncbi:hypothetical protein [Marinobacter salarius]|uniref:Uncharacterized protein n=1 Tax=Marinobacter salarius TaxID=1420917 RepID=A0A1W6KFF4_9GAMM|nr:hypothetical protein [Marinobacter salarius]ARM86137.1 hypothetical protein MARSALSMR5_04117 [Marinobacter salarius]